MKEHDIIICVYDNNTKNVIEQIDLKVPDIFNTYEVCDFCNERPKCENCIVNILQSEGYVKNVSK